jgi:hypothetical protein
MKILNHAKNAIFLLLLMLFVNKKPAIPITFNKSPSPVVELPDVAGCVLGDADG